MIVEFLGNADVINFIAVQNGYVGGSTAPDPDFDFFYLNLENSRRCDARNDSHFRVHRSDEYNPWQTFEISFKLNE